MAKNLVFLDIEIGIDDEKIHSIGALSSERSVFRGTSIPELLTFIKDADFLCGHNVIHHDLKYLSKVMTIPADIGVVDTLYLSPLLFPRRPYHRLLKDDKLRTEALNNPVNDCQKAAELFFDEVNAFSELATAVKRIFCCLLYAFPEFRGFFDYLGYRPFLTNLPGLISKTFSGQICSNADLALLIRNHPIELAYALALIDADDLYSITPPWLLHTFPEIENILRILRGNPCVEGCAYCNSSLNIHRELKNIFGYDSFRTYNGETLQEKAAEAAVCGKSLLAVFPTGGGKSLTFQLPALMAGKAVHGLTVVISPLQSLMKDQVDNLNKIGITEAVTVNGLLNPIERANALERVSDGSASLLYISPEQLRSRTIERMLMNRNIVRFVIDEAHCFSAWGQDFRVDYLYIGDFIRQLQKKKRGNTPIAVSCFTATAKLKVITDICDYFKKKIGLELEVFATTAARENLRYTVLHKETDEEKYNALRALIAKKNCPTIVYVSRTRRTVELAERLTADGFPAKPFNGKMEPDEKIQNQEAFISNEVRIMVATSAFGMGVDKKDVKLVIHYDISSSLEDYMQEAGRAGRDPTMEAECYVLYSDNDLDKHFILLNQTKLSISEIQQVWRAIKDLTKQRTGVCCSPLEIARQAGWDDSVYDIETRVKTAVSALENAGYVKRGRNMPRVYASSILAKNMTEAASRIDSSHSFSDTQRKNAKRIIKSLISSRSIAKAQNDDAESRVDYLADTLGMTKEEVISIINIMRQDGLLADSQDMSAYILSTDTENRSRLILERFSKLEKFLLSQIGDEGGQYNLKELNEAAENEKIPMASVKNLRTLLYFHTIKKNIRKQEWGGTKIVAVCPNIEISKLLDKCNKRTILCRFILADLYEKAKNTKATHKGEKPVLFSLVGLHRSYTDNKLLTDPTAVLADFEDALLFMSKIGALKLEGGFLVSYNGMDIKRLVRDNHVRYKVEDYRFLDEFYKQKIQQIHIVGEYANLMVRDYDAALQFVQDYFQMDFRKFISKYFKGERAGQINRNITPAKYQRLFDSLSDRQAQIINDSDSRYIVVAAGPGSGKTRVLVHKLASLLLLEDVKHEQLLMVTFSRAAATEFKKRLVDLIGNAANFIEIKTFHSYCFDLLGQIGSLEESEDVVQKAAEAIQNGEVEPGRIGKTVLVIDEAQDMDKHEFDLVCSLMARNDDMRVIAVGDDDQNIYQFRGSDSGYLRTLIEKYGAVKYEMTENYRSKSAIVELANNFVSTIKNRMKDAPGIAVQDESGSVCIIRHQSRHMEEAVVADVCRNKGAGKCCILTQTNDEAMQVVGLLTRRGIRAKLIQSLDSFRLCNLAEIRYFLKIIDHNLSSPVVSDALWKKAKEKLFEEYADSECLEICRNLIRDFEAIAGTKYRRDLEEFIRESNYEDFYDDERESIYVSTIHKAKGREFDCVYMLLDNCTAFSDEEKRKLYVGMTRAKDLLHIHCNTDLFSGYILPGVEHRQDKTSYEAPCEISIQMTHKDVFLDFFKGKKERIQRLHSGAPLTFSNGYFSCEVNGYSVAVAKCSKAFMEKLDKLAEKSFYPKSAKVNFVLSWKGRDDDEETDILLPCITLTVNR